VDRIEDQVHVRWRNNDQETDEGLRLPFATESDSTIVHSYRAVSRWVTANRGRESFHVVIDTAA